MRVAFVHDWLVSYRGGERVLEALCELYPDAPIYTLFYQPDSMPASFANRQIITPAWSRALLPLRKALLPVLPMMIESLPLERYDLVISTSSCVAKGIVTAPDSFHLCYIHSPMRYIWDQREHYLGSLRRIPIIREMVSCISSFLRIWDTASSTRVDRFIANSTFVAKRVRKYYGRDAGVIHPPVDVEPFQIAQAAPFAENEPYFLAAGAFVSYKRFDLAIEACRLAKKKLVIAGSGPELQALQKMAKGRVIFDVRPSKERWTSLFQHAEALLFPGVEDFGITAIEAMAAGTPVIAFQAGGALDFIQPNKTGLFFTEALPESLAACLETFEKSHFSTVDLQNFARDFTKGQFLTRMKLELEQAVEVQT
ncbi:MAG: glycosyltransferase [Oligoflexus sp.]